MSAMGKSGSRSSGVTGLPVPGWSTGASGPGRSGMTLYQCVGIWLSPRTIFVSIACFLEAGVGRGKR